MGPSCSERNWSLEKSPVESPIRTSAAIPAASSNGRRFNVSNLKPLSKTTAQPSQPVTCLRTSAANFRWSPIVTERAPHCTLYHLMISYVYPVRSPLYPHSISLPCGNHVHNYGKSPFSMGKLTINGHISLFNLTSLNHHSSWLNPMVLPGS